MMLKLLIASIVISITILGVFAQHQHTTPVPILKQINRHNEDGSYSYGYEGADGSFKIETKYPTGEVYGKYGYVDDTGNLREVEYGASRRGFEPQGTDINVPPPTLNEKNPYPLGPNEIDDGQYREDPNVYNDGKFKASNFPATKFRLDDLRPKYNNPAPQPQYHNPAPQLQYRNQEPQPQYQNPAPPRQYYNPAPQAPYQPPYQQPYQPQPQHRFHSQPQQPSSNYYNSQPPANYYDNVNVPQLHHPAVKNVDLYTGSYSIDYTGRRR